MNELNEVGMIFFGSRRDEESGSRESNGLEDAEGFEGAIMKGEVELVGSRKRGSAFLGEAEDLADVGATTSSIGEIKGALFDVAVDIALGVDSTDLRRVPGGSGWAMG